jgi:hypothetical protein
MTSHEWRLHVMSTVVYFYRARVFIGLGLLKVFCWVTKGFVGLASTTIGKSREKRKQCQDALVQRANNLLPELHKFKELSSLRQNEVKIARSQLLADFEAMKAAAPPFRMAKAMLTVLSPVAHGLNSRCGKRTRGVEALKRILERIDSATFYGDLLLWMALPDSFGEEVLGDLNEEFELRASANRSAAQAWYRGQVWSTLKSCMWRKVERLAAIVTIVDLIVRSRRK